VPQDALKEYTPRQLRLLFLLHDWHEGMDYSDATIGSARTVEEEFEVSRRVDPLTRSR
jgi:cysteinyl-tRNA synthetase